MERTAPRPLADRLRPEKLADVVGQDHLLGPGRRAHPHARVRLARLADLLGPARHRQDHRGPAARATRPISISSRSRPSSPASPTSRRSSRRRAPAARSARARSSSSTRSTASTAPSRTPSCRSWRTARSRWSAPRPRTRPSSSTPRFFRAPASWSSSRSTPRRSTKLLARAEEDRGRAAAAR